MWELENVQTESWLRASTIQTVKWTLFLQMAEWVQSIARPWLQSVLELARFGRREIMEQQELRTSEAHEQPRVL